MYFSGTFESRKIQSYLSKHNENVEIKPFQKNAFQRGVRQGRGFTKARNVENTYTHDFRSCKCGTCGIIMFTYRVLGEKVANAFKDGAKLKETTSFYFDADEGRR